MEIIIFLIPIIIVAVLFSILCYIRYNKREKYSQDKIEYIPSYEELLRTPQWYNKRNSILSRDNYMCKWCGSTDTLQVHHRYYLKCPSGLKIYPWDYPDEALMTLCNNCHIKAHKKYKIKTYFTKCR